MTRNEKLVQFQIRQIGTIGHGLKYIYIIVKWIITEIEVME